MQQPDGHIFISYSRRDDESMRRIAFFLRDQGFKVWVDNEKLIPGTAAWEEAIETALKNAYAVIIVLSPDSKESEWVRREITYADQFEKRLFPVLVKGAKDEAIPLRLVTRQYVDLRKDEEAGLNALAASIRFYIEGKQTLQMKRPARRQEKDPGTVRGEKSAWSWVVPLGIILTLCLAVGAWFGYRAIASSLAPEPDSSALAPTAPERADATEPAVPAEDLPTETPLPVPITDLPSEFLQDLEIVSADSFDDPSTSAWELQNAEIRDGLLQLLPNENYAGANVNRAFMAGEGIVIDFRFPPSAQFEIYLDRGSYASKAYKRVGIFGEGDTLYVNAREGSDVIGNPFTGDLLLEPDTDYSLLIAILPDAEFLQLVWNPDNPAEYLLYREQMNAAWIDLEYFLYAASGDGTLLLDNYREIRFSGGK